MKIKESCKEYVTLLNSIRETNITLADFYLYLFSYGKLADKKYFDDLMINNGYTSESAVIEAIEEIVEIDLYSDENKDISDIYVTNAIHEANVNDYLNDPYRKAINISKISKGTYHLVKDEYEPYQLFPLDDISINDTYCEISNIGYFKERFSYLALYEKQNIWMSLNPNEINTMKPYIEKAKGNVLVLGLGLGYYPFMISLKDDVKSITIIEKDKTIIDLFDENIFPNFPNKEKIKVVYDDAFKYLEKHKNNHEFDYVFADIWHNPEDGLPLFSKIAKYEKEYNIPFDYWLFESIIAMARRCLITIMIEHFEGFTDLNYRNAQNEIDRMINELYFKTKEVTLNSMEDIERFLRTSNIYALLRK